jgi:hypothetical protein
MDARRVVRQQTNHARSFQQAGGRVGWGQEEEVATAAAATAGELVKRAGRKATVWCLPPPHPQPTFP